MSWGYSNNGWLQTGTHAAPEVWAVGTHMGGTGALTGLLIDPAKPIGLRIFGSPLMDTCWEVIATGGTGGNFILRTWRLGTVGATTDTVAHGLADGDNYRLTVRWVGSVITVYRNAEAAPIITRDTLGLYNEFSTFGFASTFDQARVGQLTLSELRQTFAARAEVFWGVVNGTLYASDDGRTLRVILANVFNSSAPVLGASLRQHAYLIDGSRIIDFDSVAMTAEPFLLSAGTLPGQSALNTPPGETTATAIAAYNDRLLVVSENIVKGSRIGVEQNFDTGEDTEGKAFAFGLAQSTIPNAVAEPIVGVFPASKNRLLLFCVRSTWALSGDPTLGADLDRLSDEVGAAGPRAMCMVDEGQVVVICEQGLAKIPPGGYPSIVSRETLTEIIQIKNPGEVVIPSIVVDTANHGVWAFLTSIDEDRPSRHIFYDVRIGDFSAGAGGFFPISFALDDINPTCSVRYLGQVIVGTRGGKFLTFSDAAKSDIGTAINSHMGVQLLRSDNLNVNVFLWELSLVMGLGSGPATLTLYGGETPERAYDATRWQLWEGTIENTRDSLPIFQSAPALVLEISSNTVGVVWSMEAGQITYGLDPIVMSQRLDAIVPPEQCGLTPPTPDGMPPAGGEGPGAGGGEGSCDACGVWMGKNTTGDIAGHAAYSLGGPNILANLQSEVVASLALLATANICSLPSNVTIYVTATDGGFSSGPLTASAFAALVPGDYDESNKEWRAYFRCTDNSLAEA